MLVCPHCNRPMTHLSFEQVEQLDSLNLPRKQQILVDCLISAYPEKVTHSELEEWMYDKLGDENNCGTAIYVHVHHARKALKTIGFTIKAARFQGWRLLTID